MKNNIVIAVTFLFIGIVVTYLLIDRSVVVKDSSGEIQDSIWDKAQQESQITNPFVAKEAGDNDADQIRQLTQDIEIIKQQMREVQDTLQDLLVASPENPTVLPPSGGRDNRFASALTQRLYNLDNLIKAGIDSVIAEDIVRRKNAIELKRLELQDRARRDNYLNTQRYYDELEQINAEDITLREELGDEGYDQYLYNSKQNNRIRIASVMLGSAAEQAGIQKGDVILSYDNDRMFTWQELKDATAEGELGEFVTINIYRNGEIFSLNVPRGPLGMQLGATRLAP